MLRRCTMGRVATMEMMDNITGMILITITTMVSLTTMEPTGRKSTFRGIIIITTKIEEVVVVSEIKVIKTIMAITEAAIPTKARAYR